MSPFLTFCKGALPLGLQTLPVCGLLAILILTNPSKSMLRVGILHGEALHELRSILLVHQNHRMCHCPMCHCPRFSAARKGFAWVVDLWPILPTCLTHHLIAPECPLLKELRCRLHALPARFHFRQVPMQEHCLQHLFTDGSCLQSADSSLSLAARAVVHANSGLVLNAGPLLGITQTGPRVELVAMLCALKWTLRSQKVVVVWCDVAHVVDGVQSLVTVKQTRTTPTCGVRFFLGCNKDQHTVSG